MCATCWSQGVVYVGGAVGSLRIMARRAARRRSVQAAGDDAAASEPEGAPTL